MAKKAATKTKQLSIPAPDELNVPPEELNAYTILLMGAKGIGKTTASSSFPGNLNMQLEPRRKNVNLRMVGANEGLVFRTAAQIMEGQDDPWELFIEYNAMAVADDTVETITWDSVDIAYQMCFESVCAKLGVNHPSEIDKDFGRSWNIIKNEFTSLIDTIRASERCGLLFISHVKEREQEFADGAGKMNLLGPSCSPACLQILKAACEFWLFYGYDDGKRTVWCRDEDRLVDVACGTGFIDDNGDPIYKFQIPENKPQLFYETVSNAFKGEAKKKPSARPVPGKKGTKKVARKIPK